jgi:hypothetical protein
MASAAQIEAFAWWLSQPKDGRAAADIVAHFGCSLSTAQKWLGGFNKSLESALQKQIGGKLKEYVAEYEQVQRSASESAVALADMYQTRVNELSNAARIGKSPDIEELGKLASGLKAVYLLAEASSGADIAKRRAVQPGSVASNSAPRLPDLSGLFSVALPAAGEVVEPVETVSGNDSGNENRSDSGETLVK